MSLKSAWRRKHEAERFPPQIPELVTLLTAVGGSLDYLGSKYLLLTRDSVRGMTGFDALDDETYRLALMQCLARNLEQLSSDTYGICIATQLEHYAMILGDRRIMLAASDGFLSEPEPDDMLYYRLVGIVTEWLQLKGHE